MRSLLIASIAIATSGCASVQMGDPARSAEIKTFKVKSDLAQVYLCRNGKTFGMAIRPDGELDGKAIGTLARNTYAYAEVAPGKHTIVVKTMEHDSTLSFNIAAGEQKFFQTWISLGVLSGWGLVDEIDQNVGKACVMDGELVEAAKV